MTYDFEFLTYKLRYVIIYVVTRIPMGVNYIYSSTILTSHNLSIAVFTGVYSSSVHPSMVKETCGMSTI